MKRDQLELLVIGTDAASALLFCNNHRASLQN
jgi:hypothetical protein